MDLEKLLPPIDPTILFYWSSISLLILLLVSIARLLKKAGINLSILPRHEIISKIFIGAVLAPLWIYLTYTAIRFVYTFGLLFALSLFPPYLVYVILIIVIYVSLNILIYYWLRDALIADVIMGILIISICSYVFTQKISWVCKPLAEEGFSFAYGCLARVTSDPEKMHYWYEQAANSGDIDASYLVALQTKDPIRRKHLFEYAAHHGDIRAAYRYSKLLTGKQALKWLTYAADRGQPDAQYELGDLYYNGSGVKMDLNKSRKLYIKAAEGGSLDAMMRMVSSYAIGTTLFKRNIEKSKQWEEATLSYWKKLRRRCPRGTMQEDLYGACGRDFLKPYPKMWESDRKKGANQDPQLLKNLANDYLRHTEGDPDLRSKAIEIYQKFATQGDVKSQIKLANILLLEGGTPENEKQKGLYWLKTAAKQNYEPAINMLIDIYAKGKYGIEADLEKAKYYNGREQQILLERPNTSRNRDERLIAYSRNRTLQAEIDKRERQATIKELITPATDGDADSQYQLAHLLMIERKRDESIKWLRKSAKNGNANAQYLVAYRITTSLLKKQYKMAFDYYQSAARQGHPGALVYMGSMYSHGWRQLNLEKNLYLAKVYYQKALSLANGDTVYEDTFYSLGFRITTEYVRNKLDKIPSSIKRLDLEGLSKHQKKEKINNWYYDEINRIKPSVNSSKMLNILNQQRGLLLKELEKTN